MALSDKPYVGDDKISKGQVQVNEVYTEAHQPLDNVASCVHIGRAQHRYYVEGMSWAGAMAVSLKDLRLAWGLPLPPPPVHALTRLTPYRQFLRTITGGLFTIIGSSEFNLFGRYLNGEDITPVLTQRSELGFNWLRVWTAYDNATIGRLDPVIAPFMYDYVPAFLTLCERHGFYVQLTAYSGWKVQQLPDEQKHMAPDHWTNLVMAALPMSHMTFMEGVNEYDNNLTTPEHIDLAWLSRPKGILASMGSNSSDHRPIEPFWDAALYHPDRGNEWQRKPGHNAMEIWSGPTISDENIRVADQSNEPYKCHDAAAGGALLCAGTVFHSCGGKVSKLFDETEYACALNWVQGAKSVDLQCQEGDYHHPSELESPPKIIRVYQRRQGERVWQVNIRG